MVLVQWLQQAVLEVLAVGRCPGSELHSSSGFPRLRALLRQLLPVPPVRGSAPRERAAWRRERWALSQNAVGKELLGARPFTHSCEKTERTAVPLNNLCFYGHLPAEQS